jgi:hypothetical protein
MTMLKSFPVRNVLSFLLAMGILLGSDPALSAGFKNQISINDQTLYMNGEGPRKKAFITIYDVALYLTEKGSDADAIIMANHPMAIFLIIRSRLATATRISEAFREGLGKSAGGDVASIETQIDLFLAVFNDGVVKDDTFEFVYLPDSGLNIYKNGVVSEQIEGLSFKQALYGIWLSENPIAAKLKKQLLGR